ncbi:hypothetical protein [Phormidium tenue]|uniref:Uncharacterized protein n=1 Tax=Phormidium tenue NIES-30 TaxID=549789 RepID=A0A1U7IZD2_9CYAN|nr:hypothetical protein [Phormidium tenue]MBD2234586.1 hypothetical protein [Phormidium tenue FACHB-1052]OKH44284.1 hypothetical protein NIES30_22780 [Phormidium tenue NIES-30]
MRPAGASRNTGEVANTSYNLVKELKDFVDTSNLKIAFDKDQNSYLIGADFTEKLSPHTTWREEQDEMRQIIAQHVARVHPDQLSEAS